MLNEEKDDDDENDDDSSENFDAESRNAIIRASINSRSPVLAYRLQSRATQVDLKQLSSK